MRRAFNGSVNEQTGWKFCHMPISKSNYFTVRQLHSPTDQRITKKIQKKNDGSRKHRQNHKIVLRHFRFHPIDFARLFIFGHKFRVV